MERSDRADVLVVGGGPAGMLAGIAAATHGADVRLLEKNEKLGKKLYITGKGRCNVTNDCDPQQFFANVPRNPKFLFSAFNTLDNRQLMHLFERWGLPLIVERGGRVFPSSQKASDVTRALERQLSALGVRVRTNCAVESVLSEGGRVSGVRLRGGEALAAGRVIIATGGVSYPSTGSTGDGYAMAARLGHGLIAPSPTLSPIETIEDWPCALAGLTLKNVTLSLLDPSGKRLQSRMGEMLFTHFGVSGPIVLTLSALTGGADASALRLELDVKPALDHAVLDKRIAADFAEQPRKQLSTALAGLLPRRMIEPVLAMWQMMPEAICGEVTREKRRQLAALLKAIPLRIRGFRPIDEAVVTRGGIPVREINPSTMQSKKTAGLYFAGEVIDVDALTGGFNLQIAFSTGYLAGKSAAESPA